MKPGFDPGIERHLEITVTEQMSPVFDGVVIHRCYSTWSLVHHMEIAARMVLKDFLEADEEGLGVHIDVDHLHPCKVGQTVCVRAKLIEATSRRAVCEVTAHHGERLLARGTQVQAVLKRSTIEKLIQQS